MSLSRDLLSGCVILVVVAVLTYVTTTFETDPLGMTQGMPATKMPRLLLGLITVLALMMIAQGRKTGLAESQSSVPLPVWVTMGFLGAISAGFSTVGLPISFFLVCAGLPVVWGSRNYKGILQYALGVPVAIYVVFKILLGLRLPMGPLSLMGL